VLLIYTKLQNTIFQKGDLNCVRCNILCGADMERIIPFVFEYRPI